MERMSDEDFGKLTEEEQSKLIEESPDTVPEAAISAQGKKKPPIENVVGEAVRRAKKELQDNFDKKYAEKEEELEALKSSQRKPVTDDDWYTQESERLLSKGIEKTPDEIREDYAVAANVAREVNQIEKEKRININKLMRTLEPDDKKLYGETVRDELEMTNSVVDARAMKRALVYAKGQSHDKMMEDVKTSMQESFDARRREIEEEDDTLLPGGGTGIFASGENKKATKTQIKMAAARGISIERQIALDEKKAERAKKGQQQRRIR